MPRVRLDGVDELLDTLGHAEGVEILRRPMARSLSRLHRAIATYPRQARRRARFVSARQRRWFFWAWRTGVISVPYRRTGTLGRRWTTAIHTSTTGLTGEVGNNTVYGPFVQDEHEQARIHSGVWQTDRDVLDHLEDEIRADFDQEIGRALANE